MLFGATQKLSAVSDHIPQLPPVVILKLRHMTALDSTGLRAFEEMADKMHAHGRTLILCGAREQPERLLRQAEFQNHVGRENVCDNINQALQRARVVIGEGGASGAVVASVAPA